jgi:hypothetical protein
MQIPDHAINPPEYFNGDYTDEEIREAREEKKLNDYIEELEYKKYEQDKNR